MNKHRSYYLEMKLTCILKQKSFTIIYIPIPEIFPSDILPLKYTIHKMAIFNNIKTFSCAAIYQLYKYLQQYVTSVKYPATKKSCSHWKTINVVNSLNLACLVELKKYHKQLPKCNITYRMYTDRMKTPKIHI